MRKSGGRFCDGNELWLARMHRKFESCLGNTRDITAKVHIEIVEVLPSRVEEASAALLVQHVQVPGNHQFRDARCLAEVPVSLEVCWVMQLSLSELPITLCYYWRSLSTFSQRSVRPGYPEEGVIDEEAKK